MDHCGENAGRGGNRHADEVFAVRPARIFRLRVVTDVEACEAAGPTEQKHKTDERSELHQETPYRRIDRHRQRAEAPAVRKNAGCDAEGDHIRERVQLLTKVAGGIGHAGDASVERVKRNGKEDGERGIVEVPGLQPRTLQALRDRIVARSDIAGSKERGQHEHASPARPLALYHCRISITPLDGVGSWEETSTSARMLSPPLTR